MKTIHTILIALFMLASFNINAQVAVSTDGSSADPSAILEAKSTNKGFLPPRMTFAEMNGIPLPAEGLMVYCTDCTPKAPHFFNGTFWINTIDGSTITVPGAPTIVTATAGNTLALVPFIAPDDGGSSITSYTATSNPENITGTLTQAGSGTITVTGLTNGTAYTFTVTATNIMGTGAASAASNAVIPSVTVPDAPIIGTATAGNALASVPFTAPADGGSLITSYTATSNPGGFTGTLTQAGSGTITVTGLTNGTAYTFSVSATNAIGTGAASAASNSVTPVTVPGAPTIGTATTGDTQAIVTFTAPASNGSSTITSYTATSDPENITGTLTQAGSGIIIVTGLTNGTTYTFTVTATNAIGTGPASAVSNSVTPVAGPAIGDFYQGGVIFYLDGSGGGLVCAVSNQSYQGDNTVEWGCYNTEITGADGTAIGTGAQNTIDIEENCTTPGTAADICANLSLNGYDDWFLPSKDELNEMYQNKAIISATAITNGGFAFYEYAIFWSSSEIDNIYAFVQCFYYGTMYNGLKSSSNQYNVRAVRAF